ncbi:hypothetical protein CR162_05325 [Pseudoroseomonas rhizosphaerae]|uniref:Phytase-like domain-containing protein n=1 Tax=Teichococcus rhizosphaerae TaxID=1335062 RepID=A0A2C7A7D1_9PROT|nr:esterase-like activity of phytase family protein [Pseudoroseomonas rhizosphaerae]PHK96018.1 hypothetical protein CR162_05325 [Pseudoroseomonas rhizosphaerae]
MLNPPGRRGLLAMAALGGLGACATLRLAGEPATPLPPLALPPGTPLESRGGLRLNRHAIGFGGLSALHVDDALRLTAISDQGRWLQAGLRLGPEGEPRALEAIETGRLASEFPISLPRSVDGDAESLAPGPGGGWLVGFERRHRVCAHDTLRGPCRPVAMPSALRLAPVNGGLESLAALPGGRWLAITEAMPAEAEGTRRAWLGSPGAWLPLAYRPTPGFVPTDACGLPDGGALVVERGFGLPHGFQGRLLHLPAARLANPGEGAVLQAETLLPETALPRENWEGVASFRHAGRHWVALLADDNELFFQEGLLLLFTFRAGMAPEALSHPRS